MCAPVITLDGPSGSGKGTIAQLLAKHLDWQLLDSGALYRLVALVVEQQNIELTDVASLVKAAEMLDVVFSAADTGESIGIHSSGVEVTETIRTEAVGAIAGKIAAVPEVRAALLERQRAFASVPGLIADGRDMGTVVFPEAELKIYLDASAEERAQRRYNQQLNKGLYVGLEQILADMQARDERDFKRTVAPLKPAEDAIILDSTQLSIEQVVAQILAHFDKLNLNKHQ